MILQKTQILALIKGGEPSLCLASKGRILTSLVFVLLHICICTVGKETVPMFVHFGKIGMVRNNDISRKSEKII